MLQKIVIVSTLALLATAFVIPTASADSGLRDCASVGTGDPVTVSVSPSGCYEMGRPVYNIWNAQCAWIAGNPVFPPGSLQCNPL